MADHRGNSPRSSGSESEVIILYEWSMRININVLTPLHYRRIGLTDVVRPFDKLAPALGAAPRLSLSKSAMQMLLHYTGIKLFTF